MSDRRSFLQTLSGLPVIGGLVPGAAAATAAKPRDFWKELGVRPCINAAGTYTALTASLMLPEVVAAIQSVSGKFCNLIELQEAAGKRIAELIGCESAHVTAGAASALTLGTAGILTGTDSAKILRLPDLTGMKNEVLIQKTHRYGYDHAVRATGVRMVEVETAEQLEAAISDRTALMLFFNANEPAGRIKADEFVAIGRKHGIPTFNDAAADVPPAENLSKYTKMGFDLVAFSGGKGLRGPQSAGLLLGRADLIGAARLNGPPFSDTIGRGQKVNKEEIIGMMVAIESYLKRDHEADRKEWDRRVEMIRAAVTGVPGVTTDVWIGEIANHVPHLKIFIDQAVLPLPPQEVHKRLREGEPRIELVPNNRDIMVGVWMLQPGEAEIVARRLREVLKKG